MPGRKVTPVYNLFITRKSTSFKGTRAVCKFCFTEVSDNGSRKEEHIQKCQKCTDDIKSAYLKNKMVKLNPKTKRKKKLAATQQKSTGNSNESNCEVRNVTGIITLSDSEQSEKNEVCLEPTSTSGVAPIFQVRCSSSYAKKKISDCSQSTLLSNQPAEKLQPLKKQSHKRQTPLIVDQMSPEQNEIVNQHLARAIFASAAPLHLVENSYWQKAFAVLRPAYKLPSRFLLTNHYLEEEYINVKFKCQEYLENTTSVAILCDGWTNVKKEAIINFVVTSPQPIFWKSVASGSESHTAEYVCEEISKVVEEIGQKKVVAVCTDNAANMKKAWWLLQQKYQSLECYGCLAHGLNLIFADGLKIAPISGLVAECTAIVKILRNSHLLLAKFREKQKEKQVYFSLKLPIKTRWGSQVMCLNSLLVNKQVLKSLAIEDDSVTTKLLTRLYVAKLLDEEFWTDIKGLFDLLSPIAKAIKQVEANHAHIAMSVHCLKLIETEVQKQSTALLKDDETFQDIVKKRKEFCIGNLHLAAYLVDPRYHGCNLTPEENIKAFDKIYSLAKSMPDVDEDVVVSELAEYSSKKGFFSLEFLWVSNNTITPSTWWLGLCKHTQLSKVASRIMDLPATSAACERSFSFQGHVQSKKRNRLSQEHTEKLVFVHQNLKLSDSKDLSNVSEQPAATSSLQASLQLLSPKRPTKKAITRPTATALLPEVPTASFLLPELPNVDLCSSQSPIATANPSRPLSPQNPIFTEIPALTVSMRRPTASSASTSKPNEQPLKDAKKRKAAFEIIRDADSDSDTLGSMSSSNIPYDDDTDSDMLMDEDEILDQLHEESDIHDIANALSA